MIRATFRCELCNETFFKKWTDEEAKQEAKEVFGEEITQQIEMSEVCTECYELLQSIYGFPKASNV